MTETTADDTTTAPETETELEQPTGPSPENPEAVAEARERFRDKRADKQAAENEARSLADRIMSARERKTVELDLDGMDVEFRVMLGETRDEVDDIETEINDFIDTLNRMDDDADEAAIEDAIGMTEDEAIAQVRSYRDRFIELIGEHATDDSLTRAFWLEAYGRNGAARIARRLRDKSQRADMTEDELKQFRRNRDK